jgi:hypothetical protein
MNRRELLAAFGWFPVAIVLRPGAAGALGGSEGLAFPLLSDPGMVVGQLEPQLLIELDLALRGWLELP